MGSIHRYVCFRRSSLSQAGQVSRSGAVAAAALMGSEYTD
jgi:hypothetical protein